MNFEEKILEDFRSVVERGNRFVITCHMSPDGDALGSSLSLFHTLRAMKKSVTVIVPDAFPDNLAFLPGADKIVVASYDYTRAESFLSTADALFCLDFNELERLDRFAPYVRRTECPKVLIDHHLHPDHFANLVISHPEKSSTSSLLWMLLTQAGYREYITMEAATCCCAGMMTDTGNFSYNSLDPDLYLILAEIVGMGVDKDALYKKLFDTTSERRLRIMGYCQYKKMMIVPQYSAAVITLSKAECDEFGYRKGDTESLVNLPLGIPSIIWSVYLREMENGLVKVSMRSKGDFSVRDICARHFGGGGHCNAAGGDFHGNIDEALAAVLDVMPQYFDKQ